MAELYCCIDAIDCSHFLYAFVHLFPPLICIEYCSIGDHTNGKSASHSQDTNRTRQIDSAITECEEVISVTDMRRNTREITAYIKVN